MLHGINIPLLVRVIIPELLISLMHIMVVLSTTTTATNQAGGNNSSSASLSAVAKSTLAVFNEIIGSPIGTISQLCQKHLLQTSGNEAASKQLQQTVAQFQKSLSEKVASSFGGKETCFSSIGQNNNNTSSANISDQEKWEKWSVAVSHLDCLDSALVVLYELMLHTTANSADQDGNEGAQVVALRTKLFEPLVLPVLGFVMMTSVNFCKQEEVDEKKQQQLQKHEEQQQQQQQKKQQTKTFPATTTPTRNPIGKKEKEEEKTSPATKVKEEKKKKGKKELDSEGAVKVADFAAERKKEKRLSPKRRRNRRRYSSSSSDEESDDYSSSDEENEEEEEEESLSSSSASSDRSSSSTSSSNHSENEEEDNKNRNGNDDDENEIIQQQNDENNLAPSPSSPLSVAESLCFSPTPSPSIVFLGHLARNLSKLLFIWHQPAAVHHVATRSLMWQILLRSVNVFTSSSSSHLIKVSSKIINAIFDPLVEAAMSIKENIEREIIGAVVADVDDEKNTNDLTFSQHMSVILYFEIVQYLIPSLFHLAMRGMSPSVPVQMLMKMLNLAPFLDNLRDVVRIEKLKKQFEKEQQQQTGEQQQEDEEEEKQKQKEAKRNQILEAESLAKEMLHKTVLPWSISMDEASNALFALAKKHKNLLNQDEDEEDSNENSQNATLITNKISSIWRSLPSLREVCSQKLTFFKSSGTLLSEIASVTLDNPSTIKTQINWIMSAISEGVINGEANLSSQTFNSKNNNNNNSAVASSSSTSETFATVTALIQGGRVVSAPPGVPATIDSDTMMKSWHHNFLTNNASSTNFVSSEKALLIHLLSRFGGKKEFEAFPVMPPLH
jgi:hypothetical protein